MHFRALRPSSNWCWLLCQCSGLTVSARVPYRTIVLSLSVFQLTSFNLQNFSVSSSLPLNKKSVVAHSCRCSYDCSFPCLFWVASYKNNSAHSFKRYFNFFCSQPEFTFHIDWFCFLHYDGFHNSKHKWKKTLLNFTILGPGLSKWYIKWTTSSNNYFAFSVLCSSTHILLKYLLFVWDDPFVPLRPQVLCWELDNKINFLGSVGCRSASIFITALSKLSLLLSTIVA